MANSAADTERHLSNSKEQLLSGLSLSDAENGAYKGFFIYFFLFLNWPTSIKCYHFFTRCDYR